MSFWLINNKIVIDQNNKIIECDTCPCSSDDGLTPLKPAIVVPDSFSTDHRNYAIITRIPLLNDFSIEPNNFPDQHSYDQVTSVDAETFFTQTLAEKSKSISTLFYLQNGDKFTRMHEVNSYEYSITYNIKPLIPNILTPVLDTINVDLCKEPFFNSVHGNEKRMVSGIIQGVTTPTQYDFTNIDNQEYNITVTNTVDCSFISSCYINNINETHASEIFDSDIYMLSKFKDVRKNTHLSARVSEKGIYGNVTFMLDKVISASTSGYNYNLVGDSDRCYCGNVDQINNLCYVYLYPTYTGNGWAKVPYFPAKRTGENSFEIFNKHTFMPYIMSGERACTPWQYSWDDDTMPQNTFMPVNGSPRNVTPDTNQSINFTTYKVDGTSYRVHTGMTLSTLTEEDLLSCLIVKKFMWNPIIQRVPHHTSAIVGSKTALTTTSHGDVSNIYFSGLVGTFKLHSSYPYIKYKIGRNEYQMNWDWDVTEIPSNASAYVVTGGTMINPEFTDDYVAITPGGATPVTNIYASGSVNGKRITLTSELSTNHDVFIISTLYKRSDSYNGVYEIQKNSNKYSVYENVDQLTSRDVLVDQNDKSAFNSLTKNQLSTSWFMYDNEYLYYLYNTTNGWRAKKLNNSSTTTTTINNNPLDTTPPPHFFLSGYPNRTWPIFSSYCYNSGGTVYVIRRNFWSDDWGFYIDDVCDRFYSDDDIAYQYTPNPILRRMRYPYYQGLNHLWWQIDSIGININNAPAATRFSGWFKIDNATIPNADPHIFAKQPLIVKELLYEGNHNNQTGTQISAGVVIETGGLNTQFGMNPIKFSLPSATISELSIYKGVECQILTSIFLGVRDNFIWTSDITTMPPYTSCAFGTGTQTTLVDLSNKRVTNINTVEGVTTGLCNGYTITQGITRCTRPPQENPSTDDYVSPGFRHFGMITGVVNLNTNYCFTFNPFNMSFLNFEDILEYINRKTGSSLTTADDITIGQMSAIMMNDNCVLDTQYSHGVMMSMATIRPIRLVTETSSELNAFLAHSTINSKLTSATNIKNITLNPSNIDRFVYYRW